MVIADKNASEEEAEEAMNQYKTDDVRILEIKELVTPDEVIAAAPISTRPLGPSSRRARPSTASSTAPTTACW